MEVAQSWPVTGERFQDSIGHRVLYVTLDNSRLRMARNNGFYIGEAFERQGVVVERLGPINPRLFTKCVLGVRKAGSRFLGHGEWPLVASPYSARERSNRIRHIAHFANHSFLFSNNPVCFAGLDRSISYYIYTDAPVSGLIELGGYLENWHPEAINSYQRLDQLATSNARGVFYSSQWAADNAIQTYGLDASKVFVVPPGASIDLAPLLNAHQNYSSSSSNECRLLFYGRDWERKGGSFAVEVSAALKRKGANAKLTICGPAFEPDLETEDDLVTWVTPIDKDKVGGQNRFAELCRMNEFLILPTRADCTPGAIREAFAFGLPAISFDVGGISNLIDDGVNGFLFPVGISAAEVADRILVTLSNSERMASMRAQAKRKSEELLNWDAAIRRVLDVIADLAAVKEH